MPFKKTNPRDSQRFADVKRLFIGRDDQLSFFVHAILEPEDLTYNILSISGQGGVGKSTLVQRFLDEAHAPDFREYCLTALVNERQTTPASVMERFSDQFRERGHALKKFEEALIRYKEALRRLQTSNYHNDQELLVRETVDIAGSMLDSIPVAGSIAHKGANTFTDLVLEKQRTHQFLKDVARLEDPIKDLTTNFVKDLNQLADTLVPVGGNWTKRARRIVLFFDTFEQLALDIVPWLLEHFLEMEVSTNIVLVIAGRESIEASVPDDPKRWLPLLDSGAIHLIPLKTFTEEETQTYLEQRGITDLKRIREILQLSRGLPLYLSMLTSNPEGRIDPNVGVVENVLRWIPKHEPLKRQLALSASLFSLPFTQDDLTAFPSFESDCSALYQWIISQPFVQSNVPDGRHTYHDQTQDMFRRYLYQRSPEEYYIARKTLAHYYQKRLATVHAEGNKIINTSHIWEELEYAFIQQVFLLPDEESHLLGIEHVLNVYEHATQSEGLIKILRSLFPNEQNMQATMNVQHFVELLLLYLEGDVSRQYQQQISVAASLLEYVVHASSFPVEVVAYLYRQRGRAYRSTNNYERALADCNQALTLFPNYAYAYDGRGATYRLLGRYQEALADFDLFIESKLALSSVQRTSRRSRNEKRGEPVSPGAQEKRLHSLRVICTIVLQQPMFL